MAVLFFSDILKKVGLDPAKVKLIRHALTDKDFKSCYDKGMVLEYTQLQREGFSKDYDYWVVFISGKGNLAKLFAVYKVISSAPATPDRLPADFPLVDAFNGVNAYFSLQYVDLLQEYENKLIIDWGKSARMWHQKGSTEKPVIAIQADPKRVFSGFENLVLSYDELEEIVDNPIVYEAWHTALSSVNAIYLIVDRETGRQYVGSAYGKNGLLGRWACYVGTLHGNDKSIRELICSHPERYHYFQFSILQILPKTMTPEEIIQLESLYKKKLLSIDFGMNNN
jgi:hypothetical protein